MLLISSLAGSIHCSAFVIRQFQGTHTLFGNPNANEIFALQHAADIFTRKEFFRLRAIKPKSNVFSYPNMKSSVDHRSKRVVRKLVCENWLEFYSLEGPQHACDFQRLCSMLFNEMNCAALLFGIIFLCSQLRRGSFIGFLHTPGRRFLALLAHQDASTTPTWAVADGPHLDDTTPLRC